MIDKGLWNLLGENKKEIYRAVAWMILGLCLNLSITAIICLVAGLTAKGFFTKGHMGYLILFLCIGFLCMLLRYLSSGRSGDIKNELGKNVKQDLRQRIYQKILKLGVHSMDDMSMAGITQVSLEGVEQLDLYYSSYLPQFFYAMSAPVILFLVTVWIDWRVALILLLCVPLIPVSIVAVSKYAKKIFAKYWGKYTSMGDSFLDSVQGMKDLKIFQADARWHQRMNDTSEEFRKITMKVLVMQLASTTIMDLVAYAGAGLGVAMAVYDMRVGRLSVPMTLFLILVAVEFFLPLRSFGSAFHVAMNGASAGNKILTLLDQPDPEWGNEKMTKEDVPLSVEDVTFSYDGKRDVLKNVSMTFPSKGMSGIVGESGCGKSTIVKLLTGAICPADGKVMAGTKEVRTLERSSYYSHVAVISYNTYIFHDTIRNNFLMAEKEITEDDIWDALAKVNLDEFVKKSGGLDKMITEEGANISGGQKQRLAMAVGLVADKDIYIFDEATSNVDVESEQIIMKNIRELSKTKNVLVISHRLENVKEADQIYFMDEGCVLEQGKHEDLMERKGGYFSLYDTQKRLEQGYLEVKG